MSDWDKEFGIIAGSKKENRRIRPGNIERRKRRIRRRRRRTFVCFVIVVLLCVVAVKYLFNRSEGEKLSINVVDAECVDAFPIDDIGKGDVAKVLLVNKENVLPKDYVPCDMVTLNIPFGYYVADEARLMTREAAEHLEELFEAASADGKRLMGVSAYRSYSTQDGIYRNNLATKGEGYTSIYSAKPGKSEHQAGVAIDLSTFDMGGQLGVSFASTPEGEWLDEHCTEYGFIIRYPKDSMEITGYAYEPWHIRYVGKKVAAIIKERGITLEEYEGVMDFNSYVKAGLLKGYDSNGVMVTTEEPTTEEVTTATTTNTSIAPTTEAPTTAAPKLTTEAPKKPKATKAKSTTEAPKPATTAAPKEEPATEASSDDEANEDDADE